MKKYYNLKDDNNESSQDDSDSSDSESDGSDSESDGSKSDSSKVDFARGEGQIESSDEEIDDNDSDFFNQLDMGNVQMDAQGMTMHSFSQTAT